MVDDVEKVDTLDEVVVTGEDVLELANPPSEKLSDKEHEEPVLTIIKDHFTLPAPSNLIRFRARKNAALVYEENGMQMVFEETYDEKTKTSAIKARRFSDETAGVQFLRLVYTIVTSLFTGFFFVFCLQMLLFLVLDFAVESGATEQNSTIHVGTTIGVVLAIIVLVCAFAEALVIAGHFIMDMWTGHHLVKQFVFKRLTAVTIEWIFFTGFVLAPLLVMVACLLADSATWWATTAIFWFGCVLGFFVLFCFNVVFFEVKAAYDFERNRSGNDSDKLRDVVRRCILLRQRHTYSGKVHNMYLARSFFTNTEDTESVKKASVYEETRITATSWWSKLTTRLPEWMCKKLDDPYRLFTIEDVQDYRPFLTRSTWGLEKVFCRPANARYIAIVDGPGSLTQAQLRSSLICSVIGTAVIVLILIAFLMWFQIPGSFVAFVFFIALILSWGALANTRKLFRIGDDIVNIQTGKFKINMRTKDTDDEEKADIDCEEEKDKPLVDANVPEDEGTGAKDRYVLAPQGESKRIWDEIGAKPSEAVYLVSEYIRVNEVSLSFCWIMTGLEIFVFYVYPLATLFIINWNLAVLFFICATISGIRHYINVAVVIEEHGNMDLVGGETEQEVWKNKSRLNTIVEAITTGKSYKVWLSILGVAGFAVMAIFLGAVGSNTGATSTETYTYLPNFYYPPSPNDMRYPTCTMSNMEGGFGANSTLLDFAYLASIAYAVEENTQPALDSWFGPAGIQAVNEQEYVNAFREAEDPDNLAVFFKMFSFPQYNLALIDIRGTSNNWDMLADTQLWSAAALMQGVRAILPAGEIWTPILDQLVLWINTLQSDSLVKVSFYTLTTKFAETLKNDSNFSSVQVTGHSLGGGLAMITGAQAKIPAVGLSGPNALITGRSLKPPVTADEMNQYTFNIVPRRDIVPMLDDLADQFQYIRCEAAPWNFVGCHFAKRSVCELMVTCGTGARPAICECHLEYGYPKPQTDGDEDFDTLCGVN